MESNRYTYLDFPDFTQERCYEVTSKVTFQNGVEDEVKTTVVCSDAYEAMKMVKEYLLSMRDWLVTEVRGQSCESRSVLVAKPKNSRLKYAVVCDDVEYIFHKGENYYEEIKHYSVIQTIPNVAPIYDQVYDTEKMAEEACVVFNKKWDERYGE